MLVKMSLCKINALPIAVVHDPGSNTFSILPENDALSLQEVRDVYGLDLADLARAAEMKIDRIGAFFNLSPQQRTIIPLDTPHGGAAYHFTIT
jgi:hypothetical protein